MLDAIDRSLAFVPQQHNVSDFRSHYIGVYSRDHSGSFRDVKYKDENVNRGKEEQLTKTMHKDEFCKLLSRKLQKRPIDRIMSVGRYELETSCIQNLFTSRTGRRGKKNAGILQNENCGYFGS